MNWVVAVAAVIAALGVPQRAHQLRSTPAKQRRLVAVMLVVAAAGLAAVATPLLDALDISSPTMEVGAGIVVGLWSLVAMVYWDDEAARPAAAGGLVPLLFPLVLTPAVGAAIIAVAARNGWWLPVSAAASGAIPLAVPVAGTAVAHRAIGVLFTTIGVVVGVVMVVDGALAV